MNSIESRETELCANLDALEDWFSQYEYLLGFAMDLYELSEGDRTELTRIEGCTAPAWLSLVVNANGTICVQGASKALTVRAVLGLITDLVGDASLDEIASWNPSFMDHAALREHFTADRKAGMTEALRRIRSFAAKHIDPS